MKDTPVVHAGWMARRLKFGWIAPRTKARHGARLAVVWFLLATPTAWACPVPVFRYALERWDPEPYTLFVFHRGPLSPSDQKLAHALRTLCEAPGAPLNLHVQWMDVERTMDKDVRAVWEAQQPSSLSWAVLAYPLHGQGFRVAWAGRAEGPALQSLFDSPVRRQLAKRLLAGDAAVWLFIESGNAQKDAAALALLEGKLKVAEKEWKFPIDEAEPDLGEPGQTPTVAPLSIAFSIMRVKREDPAEQGLRTLLENAFESRPKDAPAAFAVFGQGHVLAVVSAKEFETGAIGEICEFLTGPCSCTIEDQLPGFDLLVAADWSALGDARSVREPAVPNLAVLAPALAPTPIPCPADERSPDQASAPRILWSILMGLGIVGLVLLVLLTVSVLARKRRELS